MQLSHKCRLLPEDSICNRKGHYCSEHTLECVLLDACAQRTRHMPKSVQYEIGYFSKIAIVRIHGSKTNKNDSDLCYCNSTIAIVLNTKRGKLNNKQVFKTKQQFVLFYVQAKASHHKITYAARCQKRQLGTTPTKRAGVENCLRALATCAGVVISHEQRNIRYNLDKLRLLSDACRLF